MTTTSEDDGFSRELSALSTAASSDNDAAARSDVTQHRQKYGESGDDDADTGDGDTTSGVSRQNTSLSQTSSVVSSNRPSSRPSINVSSEPSSREHTLTWETADGGDSDHHSNTKLSRDENEEQIVVTRENTNVSVSSNTSIIPPPGESDVSRENTNISEESTNVSRENTNVSRVSTNVSRENTNISEESTNVSRENTNVSRVSTNVSRENTNISEESTNVSRENTNVSRGSTNISRENTNLSSGNDYEDDFDVSSSREQSFVTQNEDDEKLEKENSVLIEKDGKFQLVDEKDLTLDQRNVLGLTKRAKQKPNGLTVPKGDGRIRKSSNPDYDHLKSAYGMSEQQKQMKIRRISVMQMRREEEKERSKEEEEEKKIAAEKSYRKWLADKKDTKADSKTTPAGKRKPAIKKLPKVEAPKEEKEEENESEDDERREASDKAFKMWLDEKQERTKDDKRMEKVRLAEEAQNYVVRDRKQCDKAFREWLKQKKVDRERQESTTHVIRKKSYYTPTALTTATKKKSLAPIYTPPIISPDKKLRRPRSSVRATTQEKKDANKDVKRRPKTSKVVRITDNFGYRHPASIDDFISRKW